MTDMTTSDLKAAAERLRRLADGESGKVVYGFAKSVDERLDECDYEHITEKKNRDRKICAEAYLATQQQDGGQQPAPDAAITEEWLRDVSHSCGKSGCEWRFTNEETTLSVDRWHADDSWRVFAVTETLSVWLASYKYEHQLLSLLAALGVPVKKDAEVRHG